MDLSENLEALYGELRDLALGVDRLVAHLPAEYQTDLADCAWQIGRSADRVARIQKEVRASSVGSSKSNKFHSN